MCCNNSVTAMTWVNKGCLCLASVLRRTLEWIGLPRSWLPAPRLGKLAWTWGASLPQVLAQKLPSLPACIPALISTVCRSLARFHGFWALSLLWFTLLALCSTQDFVGISWFLNIGIFKEETLSRPAASQPPSQKGIGRHHVAEESLFPKPWFLYHL